MEISLEQVERFCGNVLQVCVCAFLRACSVLCVRLCVGLLQSGHEMVGLCPCLDVSNFCNSRACACLCMFYACAHLCTDLLSGVLRVSQPRMGE